MPATLGKKYSSVDLLKHDPVWQRIREEAAHAAQQEPLLGSMAHSAVLHHERLEDALSYILAQKLGSTELSALGLREVIEDAFAADPDIGHAVRADLVAVNERDPACRSFLKPLLFFKGFQSLQAHRVANWLWREGRETMAFLLQSRTSEVFAVDINPAAKFGRGILIDHGTGVVIGETAVIDDDVSMLQNVTLGGTGKETGDRHPKIRRGVLIGAGAKILGNIEIGEGAKIGAGSVVLIPVPAHCTAAGVPAKIVGDCECEQPSREMNHGLPYHRDD
ncbi:serine O-acetyltransferase [Ferrovibrio terrae]|uniref:Serine acetyltransferase n=1 Tax=Ferrovibrio terrae TaxID=2594003 RepID=A0A516H2H5_9PROT|nr:serine O-acetyltransferase [Ferrovibrio terrae]QDO97977.1 serine O-acetyltransferase [Ferrovibrio terrae]